MPNGLTVFSGNSNPLLAQSVCAHLGTSQGKALIGRFSDGEIRFEIAENVRGKDVFVIQSTCPPINRHLFELLIMIDALKRASAKRVCAVIPYYGYARQDQKDKPRVPICAKVVADLLSTAGAHRIITVDLHSEQIMGFFDIPVDHFFATEVYIDDLKNKLKGDEIIVAPDAAGVNRARQFAARLKVDLAITDCRGTTFDPRAWIIGNVKGRGVIILDDMVNTGQTLARTAQAAKTAGAASITAYSTHAILSGDAVSKIESSPLEKLTVTDTVPLSAEARGCGKIRSISIAGVLAEVIRRVHHEESISPFANYLMNDCTRIL
jgi:ribose-phosphate pyrophosphokinase